MSLEKNTRLAEATSRLLTHRKLSLRAAEARTGVSYNVVLNMREGKRPGYDSVLKFARGMNEDPLHWLALAGYDDIVELARPGSKGAETEGGEYLRNEILPLLLEEVAHLPQDARQNYAVAVRAFTTAWVAGWQALQEKRPSPAEMPKFGARSA